MAFLDDNPVRQTAEYRKAQSSRLFEAKIGAFADIVANMFDIMLAELPEIGLKEMTRPIEEGSLSAAAVWQHFFHDTLNRSSLLQSRFTRNDGIYMYRPAIKQQFLRWQSTQSQRPDS